MPRIDAAFLLWMTIDILCNMKAVVLVLPVRFIRRSPMVLKNILVSTKGVEVSKAKWFKYEILLCKLGIFWCLSFEGILCSWIYFSISVPRILFLYINNCLQNTFFKNEVLALIFRPHVIFRSLPFCEFCHHSILS